MGEEVSASPEHVGRNLWRFACGAKAILSVVIFCLLFAPALPGEARSQVQQDKSQYSVSVGAPTIVVRSKDMNESGIPWLPKDARRSLDTVISTIKQGNRHYWLNSRGNGNYGRFLGSTAQPFGELVDTGPMSKLFNNPALSAPADGTNPKYWIENTYQDNNLVLAFVHVEHPDRKNRNSGRGRIGLALSSDYGVSFKYLGDIISPKDDAPFNVQGAPYVVKGEYFYVFAKELCRPSDANGTGGATIVARARVKDVFRAAAKGSVSEWKKYDDGEWNSRGLGGSCTGLSITPEGINHTDAAFSTYTKSYLLALTMNTGGGKRHTWINLYESKDLIHWYLIKKVADLPPQGLKLGYQYVTIVDADGSDNSMVGKKFWLFSGGETADSGAEGVVFRWSIEFN